MCCRCSTVGSVSASVLCCSELREEQSRVQSISTSYLGHVFNRCKLWNVKVCRSIPGKCRNFLKLSAYHVSWNCASRVKSENKNPFNSLCWCYCVAEAQPVIYSGLMQYFKNGLFYWMRRKSTSWTQNGAAGRRQIINSLARPCSVYPEAQITKLKKRN